MKFVKTSFYNWGLGVGGGELAIPDICRQDLQLSSKVIFRHEIRYFFIYIFVSLKIQTVILLIKQINIKSQSCCKFNFLKFKCNLYAVTIIRLLNQSLFNESEQMRTFKCSIKTGVLENFAKLTENHLCQVSFLIDLQSTACNFIKREARKQVFFCEFC